MYASVHTFGKMSGITFLQTSDIRNKSIHKSMCHTSVGDTRVFSSNGFATLSRISSLSLSFSDYLLTYQPIFYVSTCLSIYLSLPFSLSSHYLSTYLPIYLCTYLPIYLSISLSLVHLSICLAVYPSVYLSVYLPVYLWCSVIQCNVV